MIFPRLHLKPKLYRDAPAGTLQMISESGYINATLFIDWFKHFQNHVRASTENPALLIIDNHSSHITLEDIIFARENHITILTLPPHSSHRIQPLDRVFFGPLKSFYASEVNKWHTRNPGQCLAWMDLAGLFREAYHRAADVRKGEEGFKCTGIFPFIPDIFGDEEFAPASVTEGLQRFSATPTTSRATSMVPLTISLTSTISPATATDDSPLIISPSKVSPLPKREKEIIQRRKKGTSAIITSSPFKNQKELEAQNDKNVAEKKKRKTKKKEKAKKKNETEENETKGKENTIRRSGRNLKTLQQIPSKNQSNSSDDDDDVSAYCLYCNEPYNWSRSKETWIQCMNKKCGLWAHTLCAGVDRYQKDYLCEFCT